jgi:hypothetical protein
MFSPKGDGKTSSWKTAEEYRMSERSKQLKKKKKKELHKLQLLFIK